MTGWTNAIARARAHAPFLAGLLDRFPELRTKLAAGEVEPALLAARNAGGGCDDLGVALRRRRAATALVLGIGDLAGALPLARVMEELSQLADEALDQAIRHAIRGRAGGEADSDGFIALALGKHGARELNYSSDIDPILLFEPDRLACRPRDDPSEAAQRYAREIVRLLSEVTAEGYVFRVDLRLRPASEVSPLAISVSGALSHYESSALAWERAAYIRARAAAGDVAAGRSFLEAISPFVWRRSLDFGAIDDIRRLTARVRASYLGAAEPGPGFNVKLGRGGIREVEFLAQTLQLIHGGREPALRVRGTREALDALAGHGFLAGEDAMRLGDSYDGLRIIEHRLQMVNDRQTHELPHGTLLEHVAQLAGFGGAAALVNHVASLCAPVARQFDALIDDEDRGRLHPVAALVPGPQQAAHADRIAMRLERWRGGRLRILRSDAARAAFDAIEPTLVAGLLAAPEPDRALIRLERFLERLPSGINLFRLLEARPALLDQMLRVLTLSPLLAERLGRRPELMDALIDRTALDLPGDVAELAADMQSAKTHPTYEDRLDRIRIVTGETRFMLGVQLIEAAQDPLAVGAALCRTAEAGILTAQQAAEEVFADSHGRIEGSELVILALGRLGGGQLTHASDLDLVYLFTGGATGSSDGARALGPTHYFNRLAQRVSGALSVPTAEGALYEIDTRLRPQGAQGPLAVSLDSFDRYQCESAWTFEHMALARARVITGTKAARRAVEDILRKALTLPRDPARLREDIVQMRAEITANKPASGALDVKLLRGGLIDLEFIVHFLQLRDHEGLSPDLGSSLRSLHGQGLLKHDLVPPWQFMTRVLIAGRLLAPGGRPVDDIAASRLSLAVGQPCFEQLLRELSACRHKVAETWRETFGTDLEIDDER
jgi:glutamate-ammonia-ligase adenylyltransferase